MAGPQNNENVFLPSDEEIFRHREVERPSASVFLPNDEEIRNYRRPTTTVQEPVYDPMGAATGHVERSVELPQAKPYEDFPTASEMPLEGSSVWQRAKILAGLPFSRTAAGRENIISRNVPEARFTTDQYGNRLAVLPERSRDPKDYTIVDRLLGRIPNIFEPEGERRYHIQRPDTFNADLLSSAVTSAIPAIPAVGLAPASIPTSMLLNAGLAGGTSVLGSFLSNLAGAEEPIDLGHVAGEAAIGAAVPLGLGAIGRGVQAGSRFAAGPSRAEEALRGPSYRADIDPGARRAIETQAHPERDLAGRTEYLFEDYLLPPGNKEILRDLAKKGLLPPSMSETRIRPLGPGEIIADQPEAATQFAEYIKLNPSIADRAAPIVESRIQQRPARISNEIDDAFGPLGQSQREIIRHIDEARLGESAELTELLRNASDVAVDTTPALNYINRMLSSPEIPKGGDIERFLLKAQDLLTARGSENIIPGVIVPTTNPQAVQNVLKQLDATIKYGSTDPIYAHAPIPTGIPQPRDLRRMLSDALKERVPGYEQSMGNFVDLYAAREAAERGSKLFSPGNNRLTQEEAEFFLRSPETADYFVAGMRNAINKRMEENAFSLSDLTKSFGRGEGSRIDELINVTFGSSAAEKMRGLALREADRAKIEDLLQNAIAQSRASVGLGRAAETERAAPRDVWELKRALTSGLQAPFARLRGVSAELPGPAEGYSRYFLSGGNEAAEYLRGSQMGRQERENIRNFLRTSAPISGAMQTPSDRFAGGRVGRKSGGRLMRTDHSARAASLIRAAEAAKKAHNATTESILEQPDEAVARALSIANKAI